MVYSRPIFISGYLFPEFRSRLLCVALRSSVIFLEFKKLLRRFGLCVSGILIATEQLSFV